MYAKQNWYYAVWDLIVLLTTLFAAISIPIRVAFKDLPEPFGLAGWWVTLVFLLEFSRNLREFMEKKSRKEFQEFEEQIWFQDLILFTDFLAVIPFGLFLSSPLFSLFRLFKLMRIHYMFRTYQHTWIQHAGLLTLLSFVFWLVIAINGLACGWYTLGNQQSEVPLSTRYVDALYWTTTTLTAVGYGDITPTTSPQKLYAMMVQVLGFGVFTFLIGTVASRLVRKDPATVRYEENLDGLASLLHYRSLPNDLRNQIVDFYKYIWRKRLGYDETSFLQSLPDSLQTEVALYLRREVIEKVPIFHDASEEFKREIALLLKPILLVPGDYIFKAGDVGEEMYFVVNGELDTLTRLEDKVLTKLEAGDFFGEIALFKNQNRSATIKALSYCNIYALDKSSFDKVISRYEEIGQQIKQTVENREKKYSD